VPIVVVGAPLVGARVIIRKASSMPTIASVTVRFSRKYQIRKDDWVGLEAVITLAVSDAEAAQTDPHSVTAEAFAIAKDSVIAQRAQLRSELQEAQARAAEQHAAQQAAAQSAPEPAPAPPRTPAEAERRFFARYGAIISGQDWRAVQSYLETRTPKPITVEGWISAAQAVRDTDIRRTTSTIPPATEAASAAPAKPAAAPRPAATSRSGSTARSAAARGLK
jgi:hypothetical protein